MTRLTCVLPVAASLLLAGCPGDDTSQDPDGDSGDTTMGDDVMTVGDDDDDVDTTAGDDDDDDDDDDDATCDPPCEDNEECIAGTCFPSNDDDDPMCKDFGEGEWADCADGEACGGGGGCIGTGADGEGACSFDCEDVCDCPAPIDGAEAQPACDDIAGPGGMLDGMNECFLSCADGESCPDGQICFGNTLCVHTNTPPVEPQGPYEGCSMDFPCEEGSICISDPDGTVSTCSVDNCMDVDDCPEGPKGSTVECANITGMMDPDNECHLSCDGPGEMCPDGWQCFAGFICAQPVPQPAAPGFGACNPEDMCLDDEVCYEPAPDGGTGSTGGSTGGTTTGGDTDGTTGGDETGPAYNVCTQPGCTDASDCPLAPASGDAPVACGDIGGGDDTCYLDCSGGETCPDGMVCVDDLWCAFDANDLCTFAVADPSFEAGAPNPAWDEASTNFGTPLCTNATCGGGMANTGDWFIWFGGFGGGLEEGSVEQDIVIPSDVSMLSFMLWIAAVTDMDPSADSVSVLVDGNVEFTATGDDMAMYNAYTEVLVDISAYADDGTHTLRLESETNGGMMASTNIFVDDVTLVCN